MIRPTTDEAFEQAVAGMLAARRPASAVPAVLIERLTAIPSSARGNAADRSAPAARAWSLRLAAAVAVLVLLVVSVALISLRPLDGQHPGVAPTVPPSPSFDIDASGHGILERVPELLPTVPWVLAVVGVLVLAAVALAAGRRWWVGALAVGVGVIVAAQGLAGHPGPQWSHAWGAGELLVVGPPPGSSERSVVYVNTDPGEPFFVVLNFVNPGPLPMRLLGVVESEDAARYHMAWSAVWMTDDDPAGLAGPQHSRPLEPVSLAPGERINLYLVGRAGPCAYGSDYTLESPVAAWSNKGLILAYSVVGLPTTTVVRLPFILAEPAREDCPARDGAAGR